MPDYTVISRRILTGTISDLPPATRIAWITILFEAEKLRGRVKLPVRDLAKMSSITTPEAAEALRLLQEPDEWSSSKVMDGRRLVPIEGEEDWYQVVTWEEHAKEREAFFNRLRQQRHAAKQKQLTLTNADDGDLTATNQGTGTVSGTNGGSSNKEKPFSAKKAPHELPEDWQPSPEQRERLRKKYPRYDFDETFGRFRTYHIGKGTKWKRWDMALDNWFAGKFAPSAHEAKQETTTFKSAPRVDE